MVAVRAHVEPDGWAVRGQPPSRRWPRAALVIHTVAQPREGEPLWFGVWELVHLDGPWIGANRGAFYADDLRAEERAALERACVSRGLMTPIPRKEFVDAVYWKYVYKAELPVVGWFLPEDLGRLAVHWAEARGKNAGGISLVLWTLPKPKRRARGSAKRRPVLANGEVENPYRPRVVVHMLDGQRPLVEFTRRDSPDAVDLMPEGGGGEVEPRHRKPGRFLTVAKLASSLCGERLDTLADGCRTFAVEAPKCVGAADDVATRVDSALSDHAALVRLYGAVVLEHQRVSADRIAPDQVHSAASYGKAVVEAAGVEPPLALNPDFSREVLAVGMESLYGGEARVGIRTPHVPLPCLFRDYTSIYPVVAALAGVDHFLKAGQLEVIEEDPGEVAAWLGSFTLDDLLDSTVHAHLAFRFVELVPQGDVLPHRVPADKHWKTQVGELTAREPLWFTLADALRTSVEVGRVPTVLRALRIVSRARPCELRDVTLPSRRVVAPVEDLLFALAEERLDPSASKGSKATANSCASGIFAQMNDAERRAKALQHVWRADGRHHTEYGVDVEEPARWYFPPDRGDGDGRVAPAPLRRVRVAQACRRNDRLRRHRRSSRCRNTEWRSRAL